MAAISATDFDSGPRDGQGTFMDNLEDDPIVQLRVLIRTVSIFLFSSYIYLHSCTCQIRSSSVRRQCFADLTTKQFGVDVQLLRDVDTRWSSTCLMIERALFCRPVC